jgi:hypothetical protein
MRRMPFPGLFIDERRAKVIDIEGCTSNYVMCCERVS